MRSGGHKIKLSKVITKGKRMFQAKTVIRLSLGLLNLGLAVVFLTGLAFAGDQYVGRDGLPVGGNDVVSYHTESEPVAGLATIFAKHNGVIWQFSTQANRDLFVADPARYVPAYDGHCAYALAEGRKVRSDPSAYRVVDGVLYMNFSPSIQQRWEQDIPGYLGRSQAEWPALEPEPAARPSRWGR